MADQRELNIKFGIDADTSKLDELNQKQQQSQEEAHKTSDALEQIGAALAGYAEKAKSIDEANEKQRQAQEEAKRTSEELDKIGVNLAGIGSRAATAFSGVKGAAQSMGTSVRSAMLTSIKSGDSFVKTLGTGVGAAVKNAGAKFKGFGAGVKSVAKDIGTAFLHPVQTIKSTLGHALKGAGDEAKGAGEKAKKASKDFENIGSKGAKSGNNLIGILKKVALAAVAVGVAVGVWNFGKAAVDAAANAEEMRAKFETVFDGAEANAENWATNFSKAAKRSKVEVMGFMADAQAIFSGLEMNPEDAIQMSKEMTHLSYDLASFHNLADEDAFAKLRSGLLGETEGLKSMGIILNETALKQSMMNMGIKDNFNDLSESQKMQVRYNAILAQTKAAQEDVTNTSDSYTNSLKGVKGMWADFMASAGAKFTPVLTKLFNTIVEKWPTIEPMLMSLVDVLAQGLEDAVPILLDLGETLLPIFVDGLRTVFQVLKPLIPVFGQLCKTLLPPMARIIGVLVETVLPPLIDIFTMLIDNVLVPLMPVIEQIAVQLLPVFAQAIGVIAQCVMPLVQAFMPLIQMVLPILAQIITVLVTSLLPPLVEIFGALGIILQPVIQIFGMLAQAILPILMSVLQPITTLLGVVGPLLSALAPVLQIVGQVLGVIVGFITRIIEVVANGINDVINFFIELFGGAEKSKGATDDLNGSMKELTKTSDSYKPPDMDFPVPDVPEFKPPEIPPMVMPEIPPFDSSQYKTEVSGALDFAPIQAAESFDAMGQTATEGFAKMGTTAADEYKAMGDAADSTWRRMTQATKSGVDTVVAELRRLREYVNSLGGMGIGITATTSRPSAAKLPHNARGTDNFEGGWTHINEEGGEVAYLPDGTTIIPADKSEKLISSRKSSNKTLNANVHITVDGKASDEEKRSMKDYIKSVIDELLDDRDEDDPDTESLQGAYG